MKKKNIERDTQLAELLANSIAERTPDEADRFAHRVMRSLPRRRRRTMLSLLLAYIQSPFWLVTAIVACIALCFLRVDSLLASLNDFKNIVLLTIFVPLAAVVLSLDILRDTDKLADRLPL